MAQSPRLSSRAETWGHNALNHWAMLTLARQELVSWRRTTNGMPLSHRLGHMCLEAHGRYHTHLHSEASQHSTKITRHTMRNGYVFGAHGKRSEARTPRFA